MESLLAGYLMAIAAATATLAGFFAIALKRELSERFLAFGLLIVAGAMITVSLGQILPASIRNSTSQSYVLLCFLSGIIAVIVLGRLPIGINSTLKSLGITVISITLHNLPEGATVIGATLINFDTGVSTAIILALHNVPEGLAIFALARFAGLNNRTSFLLMLFAALAEILGASAFYLVGADFTENATALLLASVAGIMLTISLKELIPISYRTFFGKAPNPK